MGGSAELNAGHAQENAGVTKAATLELLRRNSREAAAVVRGLMDEELDRAAPFSLSFGAPVTAQFVIEDHALRHSWHHLARIRKAVGRLGRDCITPGTSQPPADCRRGL